MSSGKKVLIIILFLLLITLVVFGISSKKIDKNGIDTNYTETIIKEGGLFDDDEHTALDNSEKEDSKTGDNGIGDEVDELEKRIEDVLRLFDPINEAGEEL